MSTTVNLLVLIILSLCVRSYLGLITSQGISYLCVIDFITGIKRCRPSCSKEHFSLFGMKTCRPLLNCYDFKDIVMEQVIGSGAVKTVILGSWKGYPLVVNQLREEAYKDDFLYGLSMLEKFQSTSNFVQLLGYCSQNYVHLTEYHKMGSADFLNNLFASFSVNSHVKGDLTSRNCLNNNYWKYSGGDFQGTNIVQSEIVNIFLCLISKCEFSVSSPDAKQHYYERQQSCKHSNCLMNEHVITGLINKKMQIERPHTELLIRFQLCIDYVYILSILHKVKGGSHIMCDSNDVNKTLSQYLLSDDLRLVVNDLDALPIVSPGTTAKCGNREITGDFVAPEQLWPYDGYFSDALMPGYDEKTDVWKIPSVCDALLGNTPGVTRIQLMLFDIHSKCREVNPKDRPSSQEVFSKYVQVHERLHKK